MHTLCVNPSLCIWLKQERHKKHYSITWITTSCQPVPHSNTSWFKRSVTKLETHKRKLQRKHKLFSEWTNTHCHLSYMCISIFFHVVLSLSCSCLLMFCIMSCFVWTPGRGASAFATANGDPNKIPNTILQLSDSDDPGTHRYHIYQSTYTVVVEEGSLCYPTASGTDAPSLEPTGPWTASTPKS